MTEQLPPGRELDALVAEKVMGWQVAPRVVHSGYWATKTVEDKWRLQAPVSSWHPSTDWRAAGEVLERMRMPMLQRFSDGSWYCLPNNESVGSSSATGPHAISLAALAERNS